MLQTRKAECWKSPGHLLVIERGLDSRCSQIIVDSSLKFGFTKAEGRKHLVDGMSYTRMHWDCSWFFWFLYGQCGQRPLIKEMQSQGKNRWESSTRCWTRIHKYGAQGKSLAWGLLKSSVGWMKLLEVVQLFMQKNCNAHPPHPQCWLICCLEAEWSAPKFAYRESAWLKATRLISS